MASHIDTATFPGVKKMNIGVLAAHRIKELTFFSKKTRNSAERGVDLPY